MATKKDTVQMKHAGGATVRVHKGKVERLESMGFTKATSRSTSKTSD